MSTWTIDGAHSELQFKIKHLMVSKVKGIFKVFTGTITSPTDSFEGATLTADIDISSISTNNDARDGHLKSADFFEVETYPTAHFVSTSFAKTTENTFDISGDLTIKGVTKNVILKAICNGIAKNMEGKNVVSFSASTSIIRSDFNLSWNAPLETGGFILGENADLELEIELVEA